MQGFFLGSALFLSFLILLSLIRVVFGPAIFNRIVAINVVGTKTVVILALIGMIHGRVDMFVDMRPLPKSTSESPDEVDKTESDQEPGRHRSAEGLHTYELHE